MSISNILIYKKPNLIINNSLAEKRISILDKFMDYNFVVFIKVFDIFNHYDVDYIECWMGRKCRCKVIGKRIE
jgi:hypothetical protein